MEKFQSFKAILLKPILFILTALRINANHVSFLSLITAFGSLSYSIYSYNAIYFLIGIWIHIFLDSLDGALARYQNKSSKIGSFIDVVCDHVGILASGFYLLNFTQVNSSSVLTFIILYTIDIYNLFISNICKNPMKIVFRPRMFVYLIILTDFIFSQSYTSDLLIFLNLILIIQSLLSLNNLKNIINSIDS